MAIAAITSIILNQDWRREIYAKEGVPIEVAITDDNGENWQLASGFRGDDEIIPDHRCLLTSKIKNICFLATSKGRIYRSKDAAQTWQLIEDGIWFNTPYKFLYESFERIYAVNQNDAVYSDNFGNTWELMNMPRWNNLE